MKITTHTLATIMLLTQLSQSAAIAASWETKELDAGDLRTTLDQYIQSVRNLNSEFDVTNVVRLSSGRISEKKYSVNCIMQDYVIKISQFSEGTVENEKAWFDIRETLIFPSGATAEWRHPGFPGQISFGQTSDDCKRIRQSAGEVGDPLFPLKKIARVMERDTFQVFENGHASIIARVAMPGNAKAAKADTTTVETDYIEIVFSREHGCLPVSMTRICVAEVPDREFESGGAIEIEYSVSERNAIVPTIIRQETRLRDDVQGALATTWTFKAFDLSAKPTIDEMKLILPVQVLAENVDSQRQFTVTRKDDDAAMTLKKCFGDFIEIQPGKAAMLAVAKSFVGQCPDLPGQYQLLRQQRSQMLAKSNTSQWGVGLLAAHGFALWAIAGFWRRRFRTTSH